MAYHYELCMWLNNCTKFWHIIQHAQHITNPNMAKTVQKSETFVMFETLRLLQYLSFILPLCNIHTLYIVLCSFACILLCYQERQILIVLYCTLLNGLVKSFQWSQMCCCWVDGYCSIATSCPLHTNLVFQICFFFLMAYWIMGLLFIQKRSSMYKKFQVFFHFTIFAANKSHL